MHAATTSLRLRSVTDLAPCFHSLYPSFKYFNVVQSDCFDIAYGSDTNMVVAAPTGSGKTLVMELSILRLLSSNIDPDGVYRARPGRMKVIYIAPTRSLVQERVRDWSDRFGQSLDARVSELTGDIENVVSREIDESDIICATPEKFDAVSRKHQDHGGTRFFGDISLVLIDEVHLLNETRGSVLEAGVVSRVRVVSKLESMQHFCISAVRFVAVSATIPNAQDLATWLNVPPHGLMEYGEEVRPVKLKTIVKGYNETKNDYLFEKRLNDFLYPVVAEYSKGRPALVFCSTRKGTSDTASHLVSQSSMQFQHRVGSPFVRDALHFERLVDAAKKASNKQLQQCLAHGVAFHHAGMDASDRNLVEASFLHQDILVLCTTGTLAMGVNLPAHLVVIKGTRQYCGAQESGPDRNGYREYERGNCLQMIGRAGRPQFDTEGVAVIMTQRQNVERYENLAMGCEELESQLKSCFAEYLNAEIVLGTIRSIPLAVEWLKSTFMYIRAMKNPVLYGLPLGLPSQQKFDQIITERLIVSNLNTLERHKMVKKESDGVTLTALECGRLMAYYYIRLNTMIRITEAPSHASIPDLMQIISKAEELEGIRLRRGEKKTLNDINCRRTNTTVKFQVLEDSASGKARQRISTADEKIFLNDALSETPLETIDISLRQETTQVLKVAETICRCMSRYFTNVGCLAGSANARILLKCVKARIWDESPLQCKQLPNIGKQLGDRLAKGGIGKLRQLVTADPRRIEALANKQYPFGNALLSDLQKRMPPDIDLRIIPTGMSSDGKVKIQVTLVCQGDESPCQAQFMGSSVVCGTIHNDRLLSHQAINLKTVHSPYTVHLHVDRVSRGGKPVQVVASVIMDVLVGMDVTRKLVIPYNFQAANWTASNGQHRRQDAVNSGRPVEDYNNASGGVIQRLSAVVEQRRTRKLKDATPPSDTDPLDSMPLADKRDSIPQRGPKASTPKRSEAGENALNNEALMPNPDLDVGGESDRAAAFTNRLASAGTGLNSRVTTWSRVKSEPLAAPLVVERRALQPLPVNPVPPRTAAVSESNRWKRCISTARRSAMVSPKNDAVQTNDTVRRLKELQQRPAMDWAARARVILDARSSSQALQNTSPSRQETPATEDLPAAAERLGRKRSFLETVDHLSVHGTPSKGAEVRWQSDQAELLHVEDRQQPCNETNDPSPSPTEERSGKKEHTESDTASVFSFL